MKIRNVSVLFLLLPIQAVFPQSASSRRQTAILHNKCVPKGGVGIINAGLYIDLHSSKNGLLLSSHAKWTGDDATHHETVFFFHDKLWSAERLPHDFEVARSILVSFEGAKVRFFDFRSETGGFYTREMH